MRIGLVDEALELYPDRVPDAITDHLPIHVPRNAIAGVHVMLAGLTGRERLLSSETAMNWMRRVFAASFAVLGLKLATERV